MAEKMNPEVKALWVADLRSGKHNQAKRVLNCEDGFCCLGRLTDLFIASPANLLNNQWGVLLEGDTDNRKNFGSSSTVLSENVMRWAGLKHTTGNSVEIDGEKRSLTELNDAGYCFLQIADIIEAQL